ncbi:hypothetical protein TNCV_4484681 [Trichonephila clavipes]|nr:hypothetical protein TNCV_4484681 [Trichonephila clavipes]
MVPNKPKKSTPVHDTSDEEDMFEVEEMNYRVLTPTRDRNFHAEIVEVEIEVVSPSIVPSGNFVEVNCTVTCIVLKANDRRTSCPWHDEFRGLRSDYVRKVALENNKQQLIHC